MIAGMRTFVFTAVCLCVLLASGISTEAAITATPTFSPDAKAIAGLTGVMISCQTPGATIRYTTNGSTPSTVNGTLLTPGEFAYILPGKTLKAVAWAPGASTSYVKSATYTTVAVTKPYYIVYGTAVIDGDLSDWVDAEWTALDAPYDVPLYPSGAPLNPGTPDIAEVYYAARWSRDKVYVAIKVRDTIHNLIDSYQTWDACDVTEYCIHTTGTGPTNYYNNNYTAAQEYVVGIKRDGKSVWTSLGPLGTAAGTNLIAAGKVVGQWLYYEAALTPYHYLNLASPSQSVISYLSAGDSLGLDPQVVANDGTTKINNSNSVGYTGTRTENMMTGKWNNYSVIGRHLLVEGGSITGVKNCAHGTVVGCFGTVTAVSGDTFFVEASDRSSGIKVRKSGHGMSAGYAAKVLGVVRTDTETGEMYIDASQGTVSGTYRQLLAPLGMTNRSIGGHGVRGAGLNNLGLYIRTTGRVVDKGTGWFTIDDGSGVIVKVVGSLPLGATYVVVTGATSCEKGLDGNIQRMIIATSVVSK